MCRHVVESITGTYHSEKAALSAVLDRNEWRWPESSEEITRAGSCNAVRLNRTPIQMHAQPGRARHRDFTVRAYFDCFFSRFPSQRRFAGRVLQQLGSPMISEKVQIRGDLDVRFVAVGDDALAALAGSR